ncbi:metallophosphoesterase [Bacteroides sp.]|uniref:metallophosphoesterase n=1 Tax=Bacteroides sp. TaxID=29523 RepID=UPI003AB2A979
MKQILKGFLFLLLCTTLCNTIQADEKVNATKPTTDYSVFDKKLNFYVANDLGRNGYYDQKPIAELMGTMAEEVGPEFVLATGDIHHFEGVQSVNDPLWMTNYELIYTHPELMIDWFPVLGNHEYRGNTQAVLDYSNVSRRWTMPARYYTKTFEKKGATLRVVWVDTAPMIDKYRNDSESYPDACKQDYQQQLAWVDSVLTAAKEDWVIVAGHHPIYAETPKDESERRDMQARLDPILRKHKVDMYICGHIHNFQHVRKPGSNIDYITNSAGSLSRKVNPIEGTIFCSPEPGFSIVSANKQTLELRMIDKRGNILHTVTHNK